MLNASLCLLTLTQLFLQTHAGNFVQSPSALDKNSNESIEFKLDDGKPIPNNPYQISPFHLLDHTNLNNGTRTCFQPAATQTIQIKGVHNPSCTSNFALGIQMLDMTIIIRSKVSVQTGREQLDDDNALCHSGIILYIAVAVICWYMCYTFKCISTKKLKQITKNWKNRFTTNRKNKEKSIFVVNDK